jgi:N-acetylneuraminic acid mutarotase
MKPSSRPPIAGRHWAGNQEDIPQMRALAKVIFAGILTMSALSLTACNTTGSAPATFTIGGTAVNLARTNGGLVLQDNATDTLPVNGNGSFAFALTVMSGGSYNVTISAQPSNPAQICGVVNGSGIATANVTNVQVNCAHNEWAWDKGPETPSNNGVYGNPGVAAANNNPGGRQRAVTWADPSGNLWMFGGYGFDSAGTLLPMNDLWKYNGGEWTWVAGSDFGGQTGTYGLLGTPSANNIPGARFESVSWTDSSGDVWLFGGLGYDSVGTEASLNDLWKYSAGEWTWMGGANFASQQGTYGALHVADAGNIPGARNQAVTWVDPSGNFWLFGGFGYDSTGKNGLLNDLWKYSNGEWTWEAGSNLADQNGVYGTEGMASAANVPGGRYSASTWTDSSGALWLFGGTGYTTGGSNGLLNDLWKCSDGEWTWVSGSNGIDQAGRYGTQGMAASGNVPGARQSAVSWTDSSGDFWLFGGNALDSTGSAGVTNDLWKFSGGEWTWVSGANVINQTGVYGVQGMLAPGNIPGGRTVASSWIDANGNLWLFGGYGVPASGSEGDLSDLWMYMP